MANDKDFVVAGAVEVGKDTKVTLGTVTSNNIDLATGNYFADTPTGASTYTISNAGDVQSFQLEVTGGTEEVAQNFSTTLYTGTGAAQTITNGIDLSGDGGLVWIKDRTNSNSHALFDTERGALKLLNTNNTNVEFDYGSSFNLTYNSNGFNVGGGSWIGASGNDYVSWTFKKEPSFFDVVTYTGDGVAGRSISHSLNSDVGTILFKRTDSTSNWIVWHRSAGGAYGFLDATDAFTADSGISNPTTTAFTIESTINAGWNASGGTYVAYLFAHDDAADGLIQCGSYTGNGSSDGPEINLGWQPQWVLLKAATTSGNWFLYDTMRGIPSGGDDSALFPDLSNAEVTNSDNIDLLADGFKIKTTSSSLNNSSHDYIYIAIRAASDLDLTWPSSIEWAGGVAPSAPATGETDVFTLSTDDGGTSYVGVKTADNLS